MSYTVSEFLSSAGLQGPQLRCTIFKAFVECLQVIGTDDGAAVPTFRSDLETLEPYVAGKPISEVTREFGLDDVIKLGSNEHPAPPVPAAIEAISRVAREVNRYPDNSYHELTLAIANRFGTTADHVWVGAGSSDILNCTARAAAGPGTSVVYANPSFVLYRIVTILSGSEPIEVPVDGQWGHDLDAMLDAMRDDTTMVFVCNPNNPTGTYVGKSALANFIDNVDGSVLVVVDEAYSEYATADDFETCIDLALTRDNVIVTRTFSKIFGLAGLRVGYALGTPETLRQLRKAQPPFIVNVAAGAAALAALTDLDEIKRRNKANATERALVIDALDSGGIRHADSQTNFVFLDLDADAAGLADALLRRGVIVRRLGDHLRITVGTPEENVRCMEALKEALAEVAEAADR